MNAIKKICVVILNYKTYELTISYISSLLTQNNVDMSIVVVDNKSGNESYEKLYKYFREHKQVKVLESEWNGGYAYGNNYGLNYIKERDFDYVVISNNDIIINDKSLFFKLSKQYELLENPALISPVQMTNGKISSSAWKLPTIWYDIFTNYPLFNKFFLHSNKYEFSEIDHFVAVDVLPGSFFFFKKNVIFDIGLLDENTFLYGEERILAYKVKQHKLQNYLIPYLNYEHLTSATISAYIEKVKMLKIAHESIVYYHKTYLKTPPLLVRILMFTHRIVRKNMDGIK